MAISKNVMLAQMEITEKDGHRVEHKIKFVKSHGSLRVMRGMNHVKNPQSNQPKAEGSRFKFNLNSKELSFVGYRAGKTSHGARRFDFVFQ